MKKSKQAESIACSPIDDDRLQADLHSPDAAVRARAIRSLCPCHAGWEPFEKYRDAAVRLTKDASPLVRASALHVFEDAAERESSGLPTNPREATKEMLRTRRQSRFRRDDADDEPRSGDARRERRRHR